VAPKKGSQGQTKDPKIQRSKDPKIQKIITHHHTITTPSPSTITITQQCEKIEIAFTSSITNNKTSLLIKADQRSASASA
jgi:hypothetical protein